MAEGEQWTVWNPTDLSACWAYSADVHLDEQGFHVVADCDIGKVEILFPCLVPTYTYSDEGIRMATWGPMQLEHGKEIFRKWFIFKIENSSYIRWALQESCGFYSEEALSHYRIVTSDEVIDILSIGEPQFLR